MLNDVGPAQAVVVLILQSFDNLTTNVGLPIGTF
jgi:hypothetical protein